jgi:transcriptional regulator with XRE-family HTH domain
MDIKNKISSHGYTLQQVADALGITQQAVSAAINGNPSLSRLKDIAAVLGISVSELLADEEGEETVIKVGKNVKTIKIKIED